MKNNLTKRGFFAANVSCSILSLGLLTCSAALAGNTSADPSATQETSDYVSVTVTNSQVAITKPVVGSATVMAGNGAPDTDGDPITASPSIGSAVSGTNSVPFSLATTTTGTVSINGTSPNAKPGSNSATVILPTGETLRNDGIYASVGLKVGSTLTPATVDFSGITVQEVNGFGSQDNCYFTGSAYPQYTQLAGNGNPSDASGHQWTIQAGNNMGDDTISWGTTETNYYRAYNGKTGRTSCYTYLAQEMEVLVPSASPLSYTTHQITLTIGQTTVTDKKDSVNQVINY